MAHALLTKLRRLDKEAARRFPRPYDPGICGVGLILCRRLGQDRYEHCTPINSQPFAHTGGDGVHFSLMERKGKIDDDSPVVITIPSVGTNLIVGANLYDFLCFGMHRGYFAMEQLFYKRDEALKAYLHPDWQPSEPWHYSVGFDVDEQKHALLGFMVASFGLEPWRTAKRFQQLQTKYAALMVLP